MPPKPPTLRSAALKLFDRGLWVVPTNGDKRPFWPAWQTKRRTRDELAAALDGDDGLGIALVLNQSDWIDVECDSPEAEEALQALFDNEVPPTPTWQSARGLHRLFRRPEGIAERATIEIDGIEFKGLGKGRGACAILPPSKHDKTGKRRRWLPGLSLDDLDPAELPANIVERLKAPAPPKTEVTDGEKVTEGKRNVTLFAKAAQLKLCGLDEEGIAGALLSLNARLCNPPLEEAEVRQIAKSATNGGSNPAGVRPLTVAAGRTDVANAARLVDQHGRDIAWVGPWDKWLIWDGRRWRADDALKIEALAKQVANGFWKELAAEIARGDARGEGLKAMYSFVHYSNNSNGVRAMVSMARSEPGVSVDLAQLDTDPWLLNVENGTLDLRTCKLREHRQEDLITKLAPVRFDPDSDCPQWKRFLEVIFKGDQALTRYICQLLGYGLTGATTEHLLPFGYGTGANGKSSLIETFLALLGPDYAMKAAPDLLLARRGEAHPTERADLFGKRFVAATETEAGRRLAESLVKDMTGGDRIRARRMREDFWEFAPTHKIWLIGNHKPTVFGTDHGLWRRVKLIPFEVTIPDAEQDKALPEKLRAELSGILNWALAGCLDWQKAGMLEPECVREATEEYARENDVVGEFIEVCCQVGDDCEAPATKLFESFRQEFPDSRISQNIFGAQLQQRGFKSFRFTSGEDKARKGWRGLKFVGSEEKRKLHAGGRRFVAHLKKKRKEEEEQEEKKRREKRERKHAT